MKKSILIFAFNCLIINALQAQSSFDETTFRAMMSRLQTDPAFMKNETDNGFSITFGNGTTSSREAMVKFAESNIGFYKRIESNLKVKQVGNSAVVTGTVDESFLSKTNAGVVDRSDKEVFTYTFSQINNKWLWVSAQHTDFKNPAFSAETMKEIFDEYKADSKAFFINRLSDDFRYIPRDGKFQNKTDVLKGDKQNIISTELLQPVIIQSGDLAVTTGIHHSKLTNKEGNLYTREVAATYTWKRRNGKWFFVASQQTAIAAPTFTTETMKEILDEYKADSKAFFINRLSDDFRYTNQQGNYLGKEAIVKSDKQNIISTELLQPVTFQAGDLAITSGIHQTVRIDKDGSQKTGQVAATYTWQRRNGKWFFVASQQTAIVEK
jgi:ketosteroid isomerase-like protein